MSLVALKQHLSQVKMASLPSLCQLFCMEQEGMRCMLQHWIRKGQLRPYVEKPACGTTCFQCPSAVVERYEWVGVNLSSISDN